MDTTTLDTGTDSSAAGRGGKPAGIGAGGGRRIPLRWLGWGALLLVITVFLWLNRGEWPRIVEAARAARPGYLLATAALQLAWLVAFGATFWWGLRAVDVRLPFRRTLALAWAANFLNMVVKSGGMAGMALFIRAGARRGHTGSRVTLGYLLAIAVGYAEFIPLLALALLLLGLGDGVHQVEAVASGFTAGAIAVLLIGGFVVVRSEQRVHFGYGWTARAVNAVARRFRRGPLLDPDGGARTAAEVADVLTLVRDRPSRTLPLLGVNALKELSAIAVLWATLLAFHPSASLSLAVIAYTLAVLFSYVSIVPSGLGIVELSLTALLIRAGVPTGAAALTTVTYRLFSFWTPFLLGAAASRMASGRR